MILLVGPAALLGTCFLMRGITEGAPMPDRGVRKTAYRLVLVAAKLLAILVVLLLLGAAVYEHVGAWRDSRVLKQVGHSVDIGGRTLNSGMEFR